MTPVEESGRRSNRTPTRADATDADADPRCDRPKSRRLGAIWRIPFRPAMAKTCWRSLRGFSSRCDGWKHNPQCAARDLRRVSLALASRLVWQFAHHQSKTALGKRGSSEIQPESAPIRGSIRLSTD